MMEGKLIKNKEHYYLTVNGNLFAEIGGHPLKSINQALSLKNCQAIENGYDLDELANEYANPDGDYDGYYGNSGFINGFQKALEILGDKKFSEEDVKKTLYLKNGFDKDGFSFYKSDEEIIQSLQQTEWDVFFNPDEKDSEGCIILKSK